MRHYFVNIFRNILRRHLCSEMNSNSLIGRSFLQPTDFSSDEIKSLFWTASEFKAISNGDFRNNNLENKSVTLLLTEPNIHIQCAAQNAGNFLKVPVKVIVDPVWETWQFPEDAGRILGKTCNIILLKSLFHSKSKALADGAKVPVIILSDKRFANLRTLSDVFTLREQFGYLEDIHICWIGSPTSLINTYLLVVPRMGIKMKYFACQHSGEKVSPVTLSAAQHLGKIFTENCTEVSSMNEALSHSKIVIMGSNLGGQKQINDHNCKEADHDFFIFHSMPRTPVEICPTIFASDRNLTWASYRNYKWILAAFLLRTLADHKHITEPLNYVQKNQEK
ncbi:hypothetical protein HHI36_016092 [Cryptolaemus montrouzieri]|uniref:ornithine carbamoyltransferase n=1 Tax=Cryptolaemus montrouzieri TaxID=559131 RepID=A0ABD2N817_9CUCU